MMQCRFLFFLIFFFTSYCITVHADKLNLKMVSSMVENSSVILPEKQIIKDALDLAKSGREEDQIKLLSQLKSADFLAKLDDEKAYEGRPERLKIRRILDALARNDSEYARKTLVALTSNAVFIGEDSRIDLLIKISHVIKPVSPEVVSFWDKHWQADDGFSHLTAAAVVKNGTNEAIALLEKKMIDPGFEVEDKLHWMHSSILEHRLDLPLLKSCERMLKAGLPDNLNPFLVESLFDYRPAEWYLPSIPYNPPLLTTASVEALQQYQKIAKFVLENVTLDVRQKTAVKVALEKTEKLLKGRKE
jgi:hypothetical protein